MRGWGHSHGYERNSRYHGAHGSDSLNSNKWSNTKVKQKMGSVYGINLPRTMIIFAIDVVWKGIGAHTCHTPKHLADLYQESMKAKRINLLRTMRIFVIYVAWKDIRRVPVVCPNIWLTLTKHQWKQKEKR